MNNMQPDSSVNNPEDTTTNQRQVNTSGTQPHPSSGTIAAIDGSSANEQTKLLAEISQRLAEMQSSQVEVVSQLSSHTKMLSQLSSHAEMLSRQQSNHTEMLSNLVEVASQQQLNHAEVVFEQQSNHAEMQQSNHAEILTNFAETISQQNSDLDEMLSQQKSNLAAMLSQQQSNHAEMLSQQKSSHAELLSSLDKLLSSHARMLSQQQSNHAEMLSQQKSSHAEMLALQQSTYAEVCSLSDPGEREPSSAADLINAVCDLPVEEQLLYAIESTFAGLKASSFMGKGWESHTTISFLIQDVPHDVSLAFFNYYLKVRYNETKEPVPKALRVTIITSCAAGILDDLAMVINSGVCRRTRAWGIFSMAFKVGVLGYHTAMLLEQPKAEDPNWPSLHYLFLKRSFVLQAKHVINQTEDVPIDTLSRADHYVKDRCLSCSDAEINSVFNRPRARDACITIIANSKEIYGPRGSNGSGPNSRELDRNRKKELRLSTQNALDILLGSRKLLTQQT